MKPTISVPPSIPQKLASAKVGFGPATSNRKPSQVLYTLRLWSWVRQKRGKEADSLHREVAKDAAALVYLEEFTLGR